MRLVARFGGGGDLSELLGAGIYTCILAAVGGTRATDRRYKGG